MVKLSYTTLLFNNNSFEPQQDHPLENMKRSLKYR